MKLIKKAIKIIKEKISKQVIIKNLLFILYLLIFIISARFVSLRHEAWSDEAQSFLIARDSSFFEIIKNIRYEGTPALWHFLLKIFISLGFEFDKIYYLTISLTVIGIIFLFKNKNIPLFFKITLPFTYYIFFLYTVVARSYVLLFPLLMMIAYIYDKKEKHLVCYAILLILLMNVSLHGFLLAGGLWFEFLVNKCINEKYKKDKIEKRDQIFFIGIILCLVGVLIYIFPAFDNSYSTTTRFNLPTVMARSLYINSDNIFLNLLGALIFLGVTALVVYNKDKVKLRDNLIKATVLLVPNLILIGFVVCHGEWHIGILFLILIFLSIIFKSIKTNNYLKFALGLLMILQIYWNVDTSLYDIFNSFTGGKEAGYYINQNKYKNKTVCAVDFWSVQTNIYFDKNINSNYVDDKGFFPWQKKYSEQLYSKYIYNSDNLYDIYIIPNYNYYIYEDKNMPKAVKNEFLYYEQKLINKLIDTGLYEIKNFKAVMYGKGKYIENTSLSILIKKDN